MGAMSVVIHADEGDDVVRQGPDARQRMIGAAREIIRERGYHAMSLSEVVERSAAPRGSLYYHFPQGKQQIAAETAGIHAGEQLGEIRRLAGEATSAADLVRGYVDRAREGMIASGYGRGCAIAPLVTGVGEASGGLGEACRLGFTEIVDAIAVQFVAFGLGATAATELAHAVLAGVQGAEITSRALRSPEPFDAVRSALVECARLHAAGTGDAPRRSPPP
ncbi:TetR/AcrR family transcriptional regulator [Amycolatopsis sp. NPDC049253]|uniref:TetR/AcrR family transcriptional regulator n=1 Tax=Amycolatopsis sp. NPDC049253 TaxID=3155274 RepID=UPI00341FEA1D